MMILSGCSHGLGPTSAPPVQSGFGGTVYFVSGWPPSDSVYNIRVVAFRDYPPQNILQEILQKRAIYYPSDLTTKILDVDSLPYHFYSPDVVPPDTFRYVVVAMQYGSNVYTDWKVVGAYGYSGAVGEPKSVMVSANTFTNGININVDFQNLPPTPSVTTLAASR
jgi:hypothetical protein